MGNMKGDLGIWGRTTLYSVLHGVLIAAQFLTRTDNLHVCVFEFTHRVSLFMLLPFASQPADRWHTTYCRLTGTW